MARNIESRLQKLEAETQLDRPVMVLVHSHEDDDARVVATREKAAVAKAEAENPERDYLVFRIRFVSPKARKQSSNHLLGKEV